MYSLSKLGELKLVGFALLTISSVGTGAAFTLVGTLSESFAVFWSKPESSVTTTLFVKPLAALGGATLMTMLGSGARAASGAASITSHVTVAAAAGGTGATIHDQPV